jgi:hypothetical protein
MIYVRTISETQDHDLAHTVLVALQLGKRPTDFVQRAAMGDDRGEARGVFR